MDDAYRTTGSSPTTAPLANRAVEALRFLQQLGYASVRVAALSEQRNLSEPRILDAASRLGLTIQSKAGDLWVRLT